MAAVFFKAYFVKKSLTKDFGYFLRFFSWFESCFFFLKFSSILRENHPKFSS